MIEPEARILRQVNGDQEKLLRILDALRFATIENIKIREGRIHHMEIRLIVDLDNPEAFKKAVEELRTIQL